MKNKRGRARLLTRRGWGLAGTLALPGLLASAGLSGFARALGIRKSRALIRRLVDLDDLCLSSLCSFERGHGS